MREIEFLPSWYSQTRRRKRIVAIEGWIMFFLIISLGAWLIFTEQRISARESALGALQSQVEKTHTEKQILSQKIALRQELQEKEALIASLGYPVEMTRLIQTLDSVMPKEMTILDFNCSTKEQIRPVTSVAGIKPGAEREKQIERRLEVELLGVAPSDVDLANFVGALTKRAYFEQVNVAYVKDRDDSGHKMREFKVSFSMGLSQ